MKTNSTLLFAALLALLVLVAFAQSASVALVILNMCLISAIMALGVNIQWGYAGLSNYGTVGFVALGGVAAALVSMPPVAEAWAAGGLRVAAALALGAAAIALALQLHRRLGPARVRTLAVAGTLAAGFIVFRLVFDPAAEAIESVNPASEGYMGGLGLPVLLSWPVGGLLAAGAAWLIGRTALGLRSDYLAIATLCISEIVVIAIKNEDWLTRGARNIIGIPRPVAHEVDLQKSESFLEWAERLGMDAAELSSVYVKSSYALLFATVLLALLWLSQRALASPWGRMMRAIRENELAAGAFGKHVAARHLQAFVLGSAVCGLAGAMMTTLDGQFTPGAYEPLRLTFLIWVMVIVGGSGNNLGSTLGGMLIWFLWVEVEPAGQWLMQALASGLPEDSGMRARMLENAANMRQMVMGAVLLLVLRFRPRGLIPER